MKESPLRIGCTTWLRRIVLPFTAKNATAAFMLLGRASKVFHFAGHFTILRYHLAAALTAPPGGAGQQASPRWRTNLRWRRESGLARGSVDGSWG